MATSPDTLLRRVKASRTMCSAAAATRRYRRLGVVQRAALRHDRRGPGAGRASSISCLIVMLTPSRSGSRIIRALNSSAGTVRRPTPRQQRKVHRKPSRLPIAGTCSKTCVEAIEPLFERHSVVVGAALKTVEAPTETASVRIAAGGNHRRNPGRRTDLSTAAQRTNPGIATNAGSACAASNKRVERFEQVHVVPSTAPLGSADRPGIGHVSLRSATLPTM